MAGLTGGQDKSYRESARENAMMYSYYVADAAYPSFHHRRLAISQPQSSNLGLTIVQGVPQAPKQAGHGADADPEQERQAVSAGAGGHRVPVGDVAPVARLLRHLRVDLAVVVDVAARLEVRRLAVVVAIVVFGVLLRPDLRLGAGSSSSTIVGIRLFAFLGGAGVSHACRQLDGLVLLLLDGHCLFMVHGRLLLPLHHLSVLLLV
ncbi:hypothetical protein GGR52DRAFT_47510 [Hypoxylon sp. FL1284]|nr:hypothetical protein GGR52DRAFT_47510 [Hypoxylon sp. FL1284]